MSKLLDDVAMYRKRVSETKIPPDLESRVLSSLEEVVRLENDITARVHVEQMLRYIDWVVSLPWNERTKDELDLNRAKEYLEKHHYGLQPVKDRILEYLSVLKLNRDRWEREEEAAKNDEELKDAKLSHAMLARRAPILCLVGLVGTGKTTLVNMLTEKYPQVIRNVTCTTREPRPGEVHGKDYYFLTEEEFQKKQLSCAMLCTA